MTRPRKNRRPPISEDQMALIKKWWNENNSDERIAEKLFDASGISVGRDVILKARHKAGLREREDSNGSKRKPGRGQIIPITDEQLALLVKWHKAGYADQAIANRFWRDLKVDISASTVTRRRVDLGFAIRPPVPKKNKQPAGIRTPFGKVIEPAPPPKEAYVPNPLFNIPAGREMLLLWELDDYKCHWPYDNGDGGFVFCGCKTAHTIRGKGHHSYCEFHRSKAVAGTWNPLSQRRPGTFQPKVKIEEIA